MQMLGADCVLQYHIAMKITAIILAGGRARRMGGVDKGLCHLAGQPMIHWTLGRIRPQVDTVLINVNRYYEDYATFGFPVITDDDDSRAGPLAGIAAGMKNSDNEWVLSVPCDCPFLPQNLATKLSAAVSAADGDGAVAVAGGREQPVFMLLRRSLGDNLRAFLAAGGRKIDAWYSSLNFAKVQFDDADAFANINTPEELAIAEKQLQLSKKDKT